MRKPDRAIIRRYCERILKSHSMLEDHISGLNNNGEWAVGNVYFDAVSMQLEVIAEYVCKLLDKTGDFGTQLPIMYPQVPWSQIHRFRQLLAHWYIEKVSPEIVKEIIKTSIPTLATTVQKILSEKPE